MPQRGFLCGVSLSDHWPVWIPTARSFPDVQDLLYFRDHSSGFILDVHGENGLDLLLRFQFPAEFPANSRAIQADFSALQTVWRGGRDSNPRYRC